MKKPLVLVALIVIAAAHTGAATDPRPFRQSRIHGLVSIEFENWHLNLANSGISWMPDATPGHSGTGALAALPNSGVEITANVETTSPRLDYQVNFSTRGRLRVWVRGFGPTSSDDSVWVGIDGVPETTVNITDAAWGWSNDGESGDSARIRVPSRGVHTLTIWMREDGVKIDKVVLVDDRFEPCGLGPDESPHDPALDGPYENYLRTLPTRCDPIGSNQAPVVSAGADLEITQPQMTARLSGTVSDDGLPAGTLSIGWTQISGAEGVILDAPGSPATQATFPSPGTYVLRLTASDGALATADDVAVTVHALPNQPPVVSAGPDREVSQPLTVTLSGTASDDGLPTGSLTVAWSQISGPGAATFATPDSASTTVTFTEAGVYALRLTASDGALASTDDVQVTVHPPSDLQVDAVTVPSVDPQTLAIAGLGTVTLSNLGGPNLSPFDIVFWEDRDGNGAFDGATDNLLGTATETARLESGDTIVSAVALAGEVLFAGNVIYAGVDSGNALTETDETNNVGISAPACEVRGPERPFAPAVKWAWTATDAMPASREVIMTPAVADLTGDGVPDVVFSTFATSDVTGNMRAVDGRTGAELWTITNVAHVVSARSQVAIANIDGDPQPEVIGYGNSGPTLAPGDSVIVFEHDGTFKWQTGIAQAQLWGGPAIGDLDGDGTPEIVAGRIVLNADGTIRWTGALGSGAFTNGPLAVIVDLDMDGGSEVVTGRQAYNTDGTTMWQNTLVGSDGLDAIGNFDADANPEVVVAGSGMVWVLEHTGAIKYSFSTSGLGGTGGAVTIADFDNDGIADIGRAGSTAFGVYRGSDGTLLWTAPITAVQTNKISGAAFDLDGDGMREAVLTDEWGLRIFRGFDGVPLAEAPLGMCTGYTMPVIADVDADGRADIVTGANTSCNLGNSQFGIYVYSDDIWRGAGPIWNQHTYHITNVNDDATIPAHEPASWLLDNSYRAAATAACPFWIPDLTASHVRVTTNGGTTRLTARIGNGGVRSVPPSVAIAFYDGDPRAGGALLGVALTSIYLDRGVFEDVSIDLANPTVTQTIWVAADDDGAGGSRIYELNEANNLVDSGLRP